MFDRNSIFQAPPKAQFFAGTAYTGRLPALRHSSSGKSEPGDGPLGNALQSEP
jgi:hypothetical protein